jgi:pimeloyl-ACP methyl ester carboxylesterase
LVLVHGTRVSGVQWAAHRRWLEPEFEVVTPDLPRHGQSVDIPFTMGAAVEIVTRAVESAPDGIPVVLAGHSLGGYVEMTYASQHSDRLAGLVLMGSTAVPSGPGAAVYRALGWATETAGPERMTRFNDRILSRISPPEVAGPILREGYYFTDIPTMWAEVMAGGRPDLLDTVTCPVLIVHGTLDQVAVNTRQYAAHARDCRVRTIRGGSHLMPLTHPWKTSAIIAEFAREVT